MHRQRRSGPASRRRRHALRYRRYTLQSTVRVLSLTAEKSGLGSMACLRGQLLYTPLLNNGDVNAVLIYDIKGGLVYQNVLKPDILYVNLKTVQLSPDLI